MTVIKSLKVKNQKRRKITFKSRKQQRSMLLIYGPLVTIMLLMMMLIPTLIVMPLHKDEATTNQNISEIENNLLEKEPNIEIEVFREATEQIEKVPLETYVASVVAAEMPAEFEAEALKAQAVVARTYIMNYLIREEKTITDTTQHQVYKNVNELKELWGKDFPTYWQKITEAVQATEGMVLTYKDELITPTYFAMSNGYTEDAKYYWGKELPYLKSVKSKWEEKLPNFIAQAIVTQEELQKALQIDLHENSKIEITRTPSHRVHKMKIEQHEFSGRDVREKLNLRSTDFTIKQKDGHFIFTTKGYGHGVGMSQYGANEMAKQGKTYTDILKHYYQDVTIDELKEVAPQFVSK